MRANRSIPMILLLAIGAMIVGSCNSKNGAQQAGNQPPAGAPSQPADSGGQPGTGASNAEQRPAVQQLTLPEGTEFSVRLDNSISTARNASGDSFAATLSRPINLDGEQAVPRGARLTGRVVEARPSGHLKTPAALSVELTSLEVDGRSYGISTSRYERFGQSHKKHDAKWIGGGAAGGALLGALIGHGKGALIGAGVGAGGGTAAAYATGKQNIMLPSETPLRFVLRQPVTIFRAG